MTQPICPSCGCKARHTQDTSTPEINWCQRCTGCCWTGEKPTVNEKTVIGTTDFGFGWAGTQLRQWMRRGAA